MSPAEGLVLLEDLGDLTLERKFWESQSHDSSVEFYKMAIDQIVQIHHPATLDNSDCTAFKIQFDVEKFMWEMNYGKDNLLTGVLKFNFNEKSNKEITSIFNDICTKLHNEPKRIAHRDYHSRNLMIKLDEMIVIDFQDARLGPIQYDLVSLMRDSYVDMSEPMANKLIDYYLERSKPYLPKDFSREHFQRIYELQTIQRCFKACGSFASFYNLRDDRRYLKYLSGTLRRVLKAINEFPEYKSFADMLIDSGALEKKYESL
ncbi:Stress response kinase A [compost metagenome]